MQRLLCALGRLWCALRMSLSLCLHRWLLHLFRVLFQMSEGCSIGRAVNLSHDNVLVVWVLSVHAFKLLVLAWSEVTWREGRCFVHEKVFALHWLKAVSSTEEAFNLWLIVIVVNRLNEMRIILFKFSVMELVRQATMCMVKLNHGPGRLNNLTRCDMERQVFSINVLLSVRRVFGYASRLICIWSLLLEALTLEILARSHRFDWGAQRAGILVERVILAGLALVSLLRLASLLAVVLIGRNSWVELERFCPRLGRLTLIHSLVVGSFSWLAGHQVFHLVVLLQELLLEAGLIVVLQ